MLIKDALTSSWPLQYNNFEIFRVREPLVPVETMEKKQQVAAFAWEPAGDRFAVVLGDVPKLEVTFYTMKVCTYYRTKYCTSSSHSMEFSTYLLTITVVGSLHALAATSNVVLCAVVSNQAAGTYFYSCPRCFFFLRAVHSLTRVADVVIVFQGGVGKNELQELDTLRERPFNHLYWSPMGNICLLAAMGDDVGPHNGRLEVRPYCVLKGVHYPKLSVGVHVQAGHI